MEEKQKIEKLLVNLKKLDITKTNAKTAFLDKPEVKTVLMEKFKMGISMKKVHKTIVESGFELSVPTLRKWKEKNVGVRKKLKKAA